MLDALGLDRAGDGPAMLKDGRVAALWGGGVGWPGFVEAARAAGGARFIAPSDSEIDRILAQAREGTAANTYSAVADPATLHPGVLRYLREAGRTRR